MHAAQSALCGNVLWRYGVVLSKTYEEKRFLVRLLAGCTSHSDAGTPVALAPCFSATPRSRGNAFACISSAFERGAATCLTLCRSGTGLSLLPQWRPAGFWVWGLPIGHLHLSSVKNS